MTLRERTHLFFEIAGPEDRASHYFDIFMIALILSNVVAIILETVNAVNTIFSSFFYWFSQWISFFGHWSICDYLVGNIF